MPEERVEVLFVRAAQASGSKSGEETEVLRMEEWVERREVVRQPKIAGTQKGWGGARGK
jgi:hypothetical protein